MAALNLENTLRDYLDVLRKRKICFIVSTLLVFAICLAAIFFVIELQYKAEAKVIVGTPPVRAVSARGATFIREQYEARDAYELMTSDVVARRASLIIRESPDLNLEISPEEIGKILKIYVPPVRRGLEKVIRVEGIHTDPRLAHAVVVGVLQAFMQETEEYRTNVIKEMYETLNRELVEKHGDLEDAERALTKFIIDHDIIARGIEVGKESGEPDEPDSWRVSQINEKYLALKSKRISEESFLEEIKHHREQDALTALSIIAKKEPSLVDLHLRDELYEKERELAKLLLTQSELHPDAKEARGEVDEAKKKLGLELDRAILSLGRTVSTLEREEEKLRVLIAEGLSDKMVQYSALLRDVEAKKDIYNNVVEQLEQIDVYEKILKTPFMQITKTAQVPLEPVNKRSHSAFLGLFISLVMGVASTFMAESLDISINDLEDVEDVLGLTLLAAIPVWERKIPGESRGSAASGRRYDIGTVAKNHAQSTMSEAFRTLRTNIRFVSVDKNIKSFVVTSVSPLEGKSVIAANLAITMARAGEKIILVDGDLRRPMIHNFFNTVDNSKGLSSLLVGEATVDDILRDNTDVENLRVIPAGPIPPNPNEVLGTKKMEDVIAALNQRADMVIIDSAPVLTVSDSLILAAKTDGVILVFLANRTAKKSGVRVNTLLKNANISVLGSVLNCVKVTKGGYYYNYEYYGNQKKT